MNTDARILSPVVMAICCLLWTVTSEAQDDNCSVLIKNGVFDESSRTAEVSQDYSSLDWICSEENRTSQDVDDNSADLGVPIKGVPVQLGWKGNNQSFSAWKHNFCKTKSVSGSNRAMQAQLIRKASETLVDGFLACINSPGVHVWHSPASAGEAAFSAKFVPLESDHTSANLLVEPSGDVSCNFRELTLTQATRHIRCARSVIKPQVVYFSSDVFHVVPESIVLPGPPAPAPEPCDDAPSGPIKIAFDKFTPAQKRLGPYCVPVAVSLRANGQAHRNSGGLATSRITIYSTAIPSNGSVVCSGGVDLFGNNAEPVSAICQPYDISAHHTQAFSVNVKDSSADTYGLSWTLDVKPKGD